MKEEIRENGITYGELAFLLFFALMLFVKGMGLTDGQWPYELSLILGGLLMVCRLLMTEHSAAEWMKTTRVMRTREAADSSDLRFPGMADSSR